jgi:spoIIIJ-associated protein
MADLQTSVAEEWLRSILGYCNLSTSVSTNPPEAVTSKLRQFGGQWLILDHALLSTEQIEVLTTENHKVLDALQYLVNATLNLGIDPTQKTAYTVELLGCREQRYLQLAQMAEDVAQQVRDSGVAVEMTPLPAAERRLIHTLLSEEADLETFSRGQEPDRRLVVEPQSKVSSPEGNPEGNPEESNLKITD